MPAPFWQEGYIYVTDESGAEIPGSRRSLAGCATMDDYRQLWLALERAAGEGCLVKYGEER